ncbi:MAG TPA: hypothetical protein VHN99_10735 [Deinococcales bacterium]|nr:hypothetical protein [Deinococcales bacterium]
MRPNFLEFEPVNGQPIGSMGFPTYYQAWHKGHLYFMYYGHGEVRVWLEDTPGKDDVFAQDLDEDDLSYGYWSMEETSVYLGLLSEAIRESRLDRLVLPSLDEAPKHPYYARGPYPVVPVGVPLGLPPDADRQVAAKAVIWVPAEEVDDWIEQHPAEHEEMKQRLPWKWEYVMNRQRPWRERDRLG